jgi:hypothetical protein
MRKMINEARERIRNKGGRPKKNIRRDEQLAVMCTIIERKAIEYKARLANVSVSEFLRTLGLKGQVDMKRKTFPKEVLEYKGMLSHMAANLNQVAKKRNREKSFNDMERDKFMMLCKNVQEVIKQIKNFLQ